MSDTENPTVTLSVGKNPIHFANQSP